MPRRILMSSSGIRFVDGSTNYIMGFTSTPPASTDFDRTRVNLGLYIHSGGTLRPSWEVYGSPWSYVVTTGVWDVRLTLHQSRRVIGFELQRVASYDDPLSTFSVPDWSGELTINFSGTHYVQINPYSAAAKVYDVWLGDPCGGGPILAPIDDAIVWEDWVGQQEVVIEAHATCRCGCSLQYRISDPRFMQCGDRRFCWLVEEGDAGEYHPVVYATDGTETDSVTVNVTVLRQCLGCVVRGYFSPMAAASEGAFAWRESGVLWNAGERGYLSGGLRPGSFREWYRERRGARRPAIAHRQVPALRCDKHEDRLHVHAAARERFRQPEDRLRGVRGSTGSVYPTGSC